MSLVRSQYRPLVLPAPEGLFGRFFRRELMFAPLRFSGDSGNAKKGHVQVPKASSIPRDRRRGPVPLGLSVRQRKYRPPHAVGRARIGSPSSVGSFRVGKSMRRIATAATSDLTLIPAAGAIINHVSTSIVRVFFYPKEEEIAIPRSLPLC